MSKSNRPIALALFFGILIGCASSQVTQIATAGAQSADDEHFFRQCVAYGLRLESNKSELAENARGFEGYGWVPVGGGYSDRPFVVLCR